MQNLEAFLARWHSLDVAGLWLRIMVGGLMLLHGVHKVKHGIGGIEKLLAKHGLPEMLAYGVYIGEILAPVLLILGILVRLNALLIALTMGVAIWLMQGSDLLALNSYGGLMIELPLLYLAGALTLLWIGGGKWGLGR